MDERRGNLDALLVAETQLVEQIAPALVEAEVAKQVTRPGGGATRSLPNSQGVQIHD